MGENNFIKLYKTWDTDKLLDIVENPNDYQPLAIEAAQHELDSRQLNTEQLQVARATQADRQKEKLAKQHQAKVINNKINSIVSSIAKTLNPIQTETPNIDKYIKLISFFLAGLFLYRLYNGFYIFKFIFIGSIDEWDFSLFHYSISLFIVPIAGLLFWLRKKLGWTLTIIYFSHATISTILMLIMELNRKSTGITAPDTLFPKTSPIIYIVTFLFFGGLTLGMFKRNIREEYQINKKDMLLALSIGVGFTLMMNLAFLL